MAYSSPSAGTAPTVGASFSVESQADQVLRSLLPADWLWRRQTPDFFVDYHVEFVERGEPTGLQFGLQIKGTASAKRRQNWIEYRMSRKHLLYYRDNARIPIFIAVVDVTKRTAHWLFAQRYLRDHAAKADLDNQNSLTLRFDPADCFSDLDRFRKALKEAERYIRDLYPGTPAAAVSEREQELQALDPDIGVKVSFVDGHEVLKLSPQKPLSLHLRSLKTDASESYQAMLEHGEIFKAEVEITPPPSPLFQKLMSTQIGLIHFEPEVRDGCIQVVCGGATPIVMQVDGKWRGGTKSVRFAGSLARAPLSIELGINTEEAKTSFETPLNLSDWENQWLLRLPWFSEIHSFVSALATAEEFRTNYFIEGMPAGGFVATAKPSQAIQRVKKTLDWLEKCRSVAKHYDIDPILPKFGDITYSQERDVEALWALATGNIAEDSISDVVFPFSGGLEFRPPAYWQTSGDPVVGSIKLIGTGVFDFLGHAVEVSGMQHILTNMKLVKFELSGAKKSVWFKGQNSSVWIRQMTK
jgi:hypothetical protein